MANHSNWQKMNYLSAVTIGHLKKISVFSKI